MNNSRNNNVLYLFNVDGTLTYPRQVLTNEMEDFLNKLKSKVKVGLVDGSDLCKIAEQMGGDDVIHKFDYVFSENGLVSYKDGKKFFQKGIAEHIGEEKLQKLINFCLEYISKLELPVKRGTFIDYRNSLINVCPMGLSCSQAGRDAFFDNEWELQVKDNFIKAIKAEFPQLEMRYAVRDYISFDMFPIGWNKSYCLQFLEDEHFSEIHFFGDKTYAGGKDYEIFSDPRTVGHQAISPPDARQQITKLLEL